MRHLAGVFLFDFEQSIHDLPGATPARQLLVKTALEYLSSLSREAHGDQDLTRELASAYEKVGDIQGSPNAGNIGDAAGAVRSYQQAIALHRSLGDASSGDPNARLGLSRTRSKTRDDPAAHARSGYRIA